MGDRADMGARSRCSNPTESPTETPSAPTVAVATIIRFQETERGSCRRERAAAGRAGSSRRCRTRAVNPPGAVSRGKPRSR